MLKGIRLAVMLLPVMLGCTATHSPLVNQTSLQGLNVSRLASASIGEACQRYLLGIPVGGEKASIATAIKKARISKILLVEYTTEFNVYSWKKCVRVYGT